ncbi:acyl carrier protein [Eubacterium sp.]
MEKNRMNETREIIVNMLCVVLEIDQETILNEEDLFNLGFDSINFVKLIVELELKFDIEYPDELLDLKKLSSVEKIVQLVESLKK